MKKTKSGLINFIDQQLTKKQSLTIYGGITEGMLSGQELLSEEGGDPNDPDWGGPGSGTVSGTTAATLINGTLSTTTNTVP